jgi:hypothetical protein
MSILTESLQQSNARLAVNNATMDLRMALTGDPHHSTEDHCVQLLIAADRVKDAVVSLVEDLG